MEEKAYMEKYSSEEDETLLWIEKQTHIRTSYPHMLCGKTEGKFLEMISRMISPSAILEIGTFTGYSAICLARGLAPGGTMETLEINDEITDIIREGFEKAGLSGCINIIQGDAKDTIPTLKNKYDLIFIDANKREYSAYYDMVFPLLNSGGYIIADNVLWNGKVSGAVSSDAQTRGIALFNKKVREDPRTDNVILPIRDGINIIRKK
ncbi:MAG: O-methyltransferase [Bacteroidales bacterium]|jgi:predicted O-methyltransferase YrrM|nr:O-methyltransferase [Bacteroidales bacterium]